MEHDWDFIDSFARLTFSVQGSPTAARSLQKERSCDLSSLFILLWPSPFLCTMEKRKYGV